MPSFWQKSFEEENIDRLLGKDIGDIPLPN